VYYSHWILSDPVFLALTLLSLWALDRADAAGDGKWLGLGIAAAGLAYFTRSAGLPLLATLALWLLLRRRWRALSTTDVALGVPVALWWLRARSAGGAAYVSEFWMVDPYQPSLGQIGYAGLLGRFFTNLVGYVTNWLPGGIVGTGGRWVAWLGVVATLAGIFGWVLETRRRVRPVEIFFPLYAGLILLWPEVWSGDRFALPLYPLLFVYGAALLQSAKTRLGAGASAALGAAALALIVLPAGAAWTRAVREATACGAATRTGGPFACYGPGVQAFVEAAAWSGANLPEDAAVFSRKPSIFYVMSGVPSRTFPFETGEQVLLAQADSLRARYVLLDEWDGLAMHYVGSALQARPESFCAVSVFGERTQLLGILPAGSESDSYEVRPGEMRLAPCPPSYVSGDGAAPYSSSSSRIPLLDGLEP
jgi:hypothetical protein